MSDRKLYQQKKEAQLNEWQADIDKLKAKTSMASADVQIEMNKQIDILEKKIDEGKTKLSDLADAADDMYESMKEGVESAWDSLKMTLMMHKSTGVIRTNVTTNNGVVMLSGKAKSEAERDLVTKLAEDVQGVNNVVNKMTIE